MPMHTPDEAIESSNSSPSSSAPRSACLAAGSDSHCTVPSKDVDPEIGCFAANYDQLGLDSDYN
jgi:hypothetical protein